MHSDHFILMKTETIDIYINCIRQVATLLGYQEPQVLEVFKITHPTKLYWVLFPIADLRLAVETAKRILTKEKIDKQLAGQTFSTPFMSLRDGLSKRVTFNAADDLEQKIDRLTVMMSKLVTEDKGQCKPFKPQVYQPNRGKNQNRGNYKGRFKNNNAYRDCPTYNQNFRAEQEVALIIEKTMGRIHKVIRDIEIIITITEERVIEVMIMTGIEVGH